LKKEEGGKKEERRRKGGGKEEVRNKVDLVECSNNSSSKQNDSPHLRFSSSNEHEHDFFVEDYETN